MTSAILPPGPRDHAPARAAEKKSNHALPQVHVAILGARGHYAVPKLLLHAGMLGRFFTDLYAGVTPRLMRLVQMLPLAWRPQLARRFLGRFEKELPRTRVVSFPVLGAWYLWQRHRARDTFTLERVHATAARHFNRSVLRHGLAGADVVYGCDGASLEVFERARSQGVKCVLEQTIAPQAIANVLLREEANRWTGWAPSLRVQQDGPLEERERREWQLADVILAGSDFVVSGLQQSGVAPDKCRVVPYGVCLDRFAGPSRRPESGNLRVLFAGEIGLRKGVPYLLEALRLLNSKMVCARAAGRVVLNQTALQPYRHLMTFLGVVPREGMPSLFQWADVLVLPSICEGSALVAYEALAAGVPVVATPNAGVPVRDGIDGLLVPVRDAEALAAAFERFLNDRRFLAVCRQNALENRDHLGLTAYGRRLTDAIRETLSATSQ